MHLTSKSDYFLLILFRLSNSELWHCVLLEMDINISRKNTSSIFLVDSEDRGTMSSENVSIHFQDCTVAQPRRPQSEHSSLWKPERTHFNDVIHTAWSELYSIVSFQEVYGLLPFYLSEHGPTEITILLTFVGFL